MIVKVQKPWHTTEPKPAYLVYNETRSFEGYIPLGDYSALDDAMKDSLKRYFHLLSHSIESWSLTMPDIDFSRVCPDQDW